MKILFLGDVVGITGCLKIQNNLLDQIKKKKIDKQKKIIKIEKIRHK